MNSSGQKTGFSIAVMIGVIIIAGIAVDWWDARQSHLVVKSPVETVTEDATMKRLMGEIEELKKELVLVRIQNDELLRTQNDSLRKQIEELNQKLADPSKLDVVKGDKPVSD